MVPLSHLPDINAGLNSLSTLCLICGYFAIRRGRTSTHRVFMLSACVASTLFLISYLIYHYYVGSVAFQGEGWIRPVYFSVLITHAVLAAAIVPLVLITLTKALRGSFQSHRRIARWTFPIWLYVSVTGVVVYWMLYRL
ncbi:MAG: DUF420 domain-containing protein [Deltaproteobacteria bacterium]|nr:DUF420 domain-containing protein [Deltaproteobacteria bacterium]